ncbi:hypothetical protein S83_047699 [Arachis hypogaea]|nr:uncharacterized protein DS421_14g461610 [Arachis hypogaea]
MDDTNDDNRPTIDNEVSKLIAQKESTSHAIESEAANKLNEWKDSTTDAIESEATKLIAFRESTTDSMKNEIALKESTTDEIKSKTTNKLIQLKESATDAIESDETTRLIPSKESSINDTIENNADTKLNEWRETKQNHYWVVSGHNLSHSTSPIFRHISGKGTRTLTCRRPSRSGRDTREPERTLCNEKRSSGSVCNLFFIADPRGPKQT